MGPEQQSPAGQGGASREMLAGRSHEILTARDWRTQLIACRHYVSQQFAALIQVEHYGEAAHES